MFSPKPNIPYKFVFQEINNNLSVESNIIITFTKENSIYLVERCFGFTPYECYDDHDCRYVCYCCYMDNTIVLNSCITLNSLDISKIYLEEELIWSL